MKKNNIDRLLAALIILLCCQFSLFACYHKEDERKNKIQLGLNLADASHSISPLLNGAHFVYGCEHDLLYQDQRISDWMKEAKTGIIRWPGGTAVMRYHWDALTGDNFGPDRWDIKYVEQSISPVNYMDLDEFIAYCRKVNAEPMVGVNIYSGKFHRTDTEGLDEAERLINYCREKNYHVKYWYIGNEGYAKGFSSKLLPTYIDKYAEVLKKVDPDIQIVADWKFGPESKERFQESLHIIRNSKHIDIMEYHEKWGEGWGLSSGQTVDEWKNDIPLYSGLLTNYCRRFHEEMKQMGRQVKLGMNEWGLGVIKDANPYQIALLAADYMMVIYGGDLYSACYWNLNIGDPPTRILKTTKDGVSLVELNPISKIFTLFSHTLGGQYIPLQSSEKRIYGFGAISSDKKKLHLLVLNKSIEDCETELTLFGLEVNGIIEIESLDELGRQTNYSIKGTNNNKIRLLPYSLTHIEISL